MQLTSLWVDLLKGSLLSSLFQYLLWSWRYVELPAGQSTQWFSISLGKLRKRQEGCLCQVTTECERLQKNMPWSLEGAAGYSILKEIRVLLRITCIKNNAFLLHLLDQIRITLLVSTEFCWCKINVRLWKIRPIICALDLKLMVALAFYCINHVLS